jgi:hypothetical protein
MQLLPRWKISFEIRKRLKGFEVGDKPHLDPESGALFPELLAKSRRYLEFGAGGSTVLAARTNKIGMCVEGDRFFLRDVKRKIADITHQMTLFHADIGETSKWGFPWYREASPGRVERWRSYVETPFLGLNEPFYDFILVDGRFRVACVLKALREGALRKASFKVMIDDYRGREYYRIIEEFADMRMVGRSGVIDVVDGVVKRVPDEDTIERFIGDVR